MASAALGEALVQAVYEDWRSAPVSEPLRQMLGFLQKLSLTPAETTPADIAALRATGLSDTAISDAIHICAMFNMIVRIADTLGFDVPERLGSVEYGAAALGRGYALGG
ncbi:MAG TPA: hypothetical protein PLL45_19745 [Thermoflexales bacterium]|nr:hypothetical protein [Thermoflexales bacterium]HQY27123.1 hypothetical protein [Thermoflexales bacterium]HRA54710.1 hypothetical protein [Thermoflexales bacterium]